MNFEVIKFVVRKYSSVESRKGFIGFVWWAAVISIALGVIALTISVSVLDGFQKAIQENAIRFTAHIKVMTFTRKPILNIDEELKKIIAVDGVESAFPSITKEVLIRTKSAVDGITLQNLHKGNIESLRKIELNTRKNLYECKGIIVGKMLADRLSLKLGDTVLLMSISVADSLALPKVNFVRTIVEGMFESGMGKYDDLFAYTNIDIFQEFNSKEKNVANSIDVYVKNIKQIDTIAKRIENALWYPFYCFTFYDLHSSIFAWIELQKEPIPIVLSLITLVAIFNVVTFLLVNVVEKTKSIGIFSTLGLSSKEISFIFLFLGMKIALLGLIFGVMFSLVFALLQVNFGIIHLDSKIYYFSVLPISISFSKYFLVIVFTLLLTFLSSLIPALIASRIKPVKAIRFIK